MDGGKIGLFDNEDALLKWTVSGPIIWEMLRDINRKLGDAREGLFQLHHKDTDAFEKTFRLETSAVIEPLFKSTSNSFLKTESSLICITAKHVLQIQSKFLKKFGKSHTTPL